MAPQKPYEAYQKWPEPNYAELKSWSAHPDKEDFADKNPKGTKAENQAEAKADVFYIHPTTFMGGLDWNADCYDPELNAKTDERAVMHQASVFNRSCRVFAPRYRQMAFGGYFSADTSSKRKALTLAYSDVKKAFEYYLKNENEGRPIVIAGHSQGAFHAQRILREFFDGTQLQGQLVAAYVPGWPFRKDDFTYLKVCDSPNQTSCVMGWNSWKEKSEPEGLDTYYKDAVVVNPINWRADGSFAPDSLHKGYLNGKYSKLKARTLHSQAHQGILWVRSPIPLAPVKNFHVGDYNLFWLDIRENVALRVKTYVMENNPVQTTAD